jgi:uncharacterized phage-associated protein
MATADDVAAFILRARGPMTAMKLQKLVYYSQAWSLVWDEVKLFPERIEAWAAGPVVPALYDRHRGEYLLDRWPVGNADSLAPAEKATVEAVLKFYGDKSSQWLSDLTHSENPWKDAREGIAPGDRGNREITHAAMAEYYGSLPAGQESTT